jgi:uncharacterized protein (DUF2252 family)
MTEPRKTPKERHEYGRSLRNRTPIESHAEWSPKPGRTNPVELVEDQNGDRLPWLVPVRRARMAVSPFTFYRGGARIMAADLAPTLVSGLHTQICGDAHLANFGIYASPERRLVFDLNDFDETLVGPWEWDVKRLAASLVIAGRHNGLNRKESRHIARRCVRTYGRAMSVLADMRLTDVWYSMVETDEIIDAVENRELKKEAGKAFNKARRADSRKALDRLAEEVDGQYRIRHEPPLLVPLRNLHEASARDRLRDETVQAFDHYRKTLPDDVDLLLGQFRLIDSALKVVGVGSAGTRCFILLFEGRDRGDPLFLQLKQAGPSVLEEHLPRSRYANAGQRVVEGQRLMQTVSDIFLGWTRSPAGGHEYYCRQLKDWKYSANFEKTSRGFLLASTDIRGWTLARAHARAGDPAAISGYLGSGKAFARAVVEFAERYADQNEQDYAAFVAEIDNGRLEAAELE